MTDQVLYKTLLYKHYELDYCTTPEILDKICDFEFFPTDIILSTFHRSGTTFTQEIIWQILNRKTVKRNEKVDMNMKRFPFLEFDHNFLPELFTQDCIEVLESQRNEPYRLIKTHLPYDLIKTNVEKVSPKFIVVMRNPKDCLVSNFYFHTNQRRPFKGTFNDFFDLFLNDDSFVGRYFDDNLKWWSLRDRKNVLILFYEDLLEYLPFNVEKVASFLGVTLTEDERDKIVHNSSFSTMYKNPKVNFKYDSGFTFLRKGQIGDWKNLISKEQNVILDERIEKKFKESGLKFIYE